MTVASWLNLPCEVHLGQHTGHDCTCPSFEIDQPAEYWVESSLLFLGAFKM